MNSHGVVCQFKSGFFVVAFAGFARIENNPPGTAFFAEIELK